MKIVKYSLCFGKLLATKILAIDSLTVIQRRLQSTSVIFIYSKNRICHPTNSLTYSAPPDTQYIVTIRIQAIFIKPS